MNQERLWAKARAAGFDPARHKTMTALAREIGVEDSTVGRWFEKPGKKGKATAPSGPQLVRLALLLKTTPAFLIGEGEDELREFVAAFIKDTYGEEAGRLFELLPALADGDKGRLLGQAEEMMAHRRRQEVARQEQLPTNSSKTPPGFKTPPASRPRRGN